MSSDTKLSFIPTLKLSETYHTLYELQQKLSIHDEYLLNTKKCSLRDVVKRENLSKLLESSKEARNNLITWYLKQSLVELNVTISLLTAKIKFIEYKLGLCDGLDLHQACSLSLVDFCNILSDMTVVNVNTTERKTLKQISAEVGIPVWLSHYRNQICHVPSESPCISILVPLVAKSLNYMRESFWLKVLEHESFDEQKFRKYMKYISKLTYVTSLNKRLHLKKGLDMSKKRIEFAEQNLVKYSKICLALRRMIIQNPKQSIDILSRFITSVKFQDKSRNSALLLEQLIFAKHFESFVFKLISLVEQSPRSVAKFSWLIHIIQLVSLRNSAVLKKTLKRMELSASPHIKNLTDLPSVKCCQIAYRLVKLDVPQARKSLITICHKLVSILGKERTILLIKMTKLMNSVEN